MDGNGFFRSITDDVVVFMIDFWYDNISRRDHRTSGLLPAILFTYVEELGGLKTSQQESSSTCVTHPFCRFVIKCNHFWTYFRHDFPHLIPDLGPVL